MKETGAFGKGLCTTGGGDEFIILGREGPAEGDDGADESVSCVGEIGS